MERDLRGRVTLEIHRRMLACHVRPGDWLLEADAGPSFTGAVPLARITRLPRLLRSPSW